MVESRSNRGGALKTALIVVAVLVVIASFGSRGGSKTASKKVSSSDESAQVTEQATKETEPAAEEAPAEPEPEPESEPEPDFSALSVGQTVTYKNGLAVTVNSVTRGLVNYDGDLITGITVTYANTGSDSQSFNPYDWDGEDASGVQRSQAYYSEATNELGSGKLSPGGSVTGNVYFDGDIVRAIYTENVWDKDSIAAWIL